MGHLDRRLARGRVAIEREEPVASERVERRLHRLGVDLDGREFRERHPPAGVRDTLAEGDQPQEQLTDGLPTHPVSSRVQLLAPRGERASHAAGVPVGRQRQPPVLAPLEQFSEGVLHKREGARLLGDVRGDLCHEGRLHPQAHGARRSNDGPLELVRSEGCHHLGAGSKEGTEPRVVERPIEEVGT